MPPVTAKGERVVVAALCIGLPILIFTVLTLTSPLNTTTSAPFVDLVTENSDIDEMVKENNLLKERVQRLTAELIKSKIGNDVAGQRGVEAGMGKRPPVPAKAPISSEPTKSISLLPSEESLILQPIPFKDPADLNSAAVTELRPFELYRQPSDDWFLTAKKILEDSKPQLMNSRFHVNDPNQRVTLVTCLFDLGRGKLANVGQFKRPFTEYIQRFQRVFEVNMPMIVFMDAQHVSELDMTRHTAGITIIPLSVSDLEKMFQPYFDRIEEIRNSELYKKQALKTGWLQFAPQAALKYYNLLVMAKVFFLRWASQLNPHRTQYHLFVDAGHDCIGALRPTHLHFFRKLMGRMTVSYFDYITGLEGETHGMPQRAYRSYLGFDNGMTESCCRVVRGGIFGGTPAYIDTFAKIYNVLLSQTLSDGYMGTEENLLGILLYRFPELFNAYHNHDGDNCRLFVDAGEASEVDREIYTQGAVPDQWDSITRRFTHEGGSSVPIEGSLIRG
eukprot:c7772_g1_i2.p1 GENE.c7772_g1_i2~~c7772_g1_i2.p1  ORF type:complete len:503 (-),score=101.78 c7772_g1_i2:333-1841(-)